MEEVLAGIWQELLGVERVGRNDSFFDLGGHSLLAVKLMQRMTEQGINTTLASLFQEPTVSAQARYGSSDLGLDALDSYIVPMREGTGDPLFFIHEALGESLPYVELTMLLRGEFPVYGIEASWRARGTVCLLRWNTWPRSMQKPSGGNSPMVPIVSPVGQEEVCLLTRSQDSFSSMAGK